MNAVSIALLLLSVVLGSARNVLSKSISHVKFGKRSFFTLQSIIFFMGALVLIPGTIGTLCSPLTVLLAIIYGMLLLLAQWCYTAAMANGNTAVCSTVYSLGFILPALSGMIFWNEEVTALKIAGVILVIPAIVLSGKNDVARQSAKRTGYMLPLMLAMLASGGLGIMQKIQGSSPFPEQRSVFVFLSFVLAGAVSLVLALCKKNGEIIRPVSKISAVGIGICFALCNLLNTLLAARLDSAVFFPSLNIGVILCSMLFSIPLFKEKFTKRLALVLLFAFSAIILVNL
ncbi:MAG: EamA family transporter [Clostridia bacterium]|nr:EamA family transporter [Clostridia bacterium]